MALCPLLGMLIGAALVFVASKVGLPVLGLLLFPICIFAGLAAGPICYGKCYRYLAARVWRGSE